MGNRRTTSGSEIRQRLTRLQQFCQATAQDLEEAACRPQEVFSPRAKVLREALIRGGGESGPLPPTLATRWRLGGRDRGWYRGITFSASYSLHALGQVTPPAEFLDAIPANHRNGFPEVTQNRGLRFVGGPTIGVAFRW